MREPFTQFSEQLIASALRQRGMKDFIDHFLFVTERGGRECKYAAQAADELMGDFVYLHD
jgi:hypothetical protein